MHSLISLVYSLGVLLTTVVHILSSIVDTGSFFPQGHPRLISALSKVYDRLLERPTPLDGNREILVTDGAYEALYTAILGFVNPGDEVIIVEPYFDCYEPMVKLGGGTPKYAPLRPVCVRGVIQ